MPRTQSDTEDDRRIVKWFRIAQSIVIAIAGCMAVVIRMQVLRSDGALGLYFVAVLMSIPAMWCQFKVLASTRMRRPAIVCARPALDVLMAILWTMALFAVASWLVDGVKEGDRQSGTDDRPQCEVLAYGNLTTCYLSFINACIAFALLMSFAMAGWMGLGVAMKYRRIRPTKTADLETDYSENQKSAPEDTRDPCRQPHRVPATPTADDAHPGRPLFDQPSSNLTMTSPPPPHHRHQETAEEPVMMPTGYVVPSALPPTDYEQTSGGKIGSLQASYRTDFGYRVR